MSDILFHFRTIDRLIAMQSKNWKQWLDEFLEAKGDFGARDLNDLGLTPYGDDSDRRRSEIRSLEQKLKSFIDRTQAYFDRISSDHSSKKSDD